MILSIFKRLRVDQRQKAAALFSFFGFAILILRIGCLRNG